MYPDWMMRMKFDQNIMPEGLGFVKPLPWGVSKRQPKYGHFKREVLSFQGKTQNENEQAYRQGGIIQQPMLYPVNPQEIIRCTALAISRRAELMGPLGRNDALTADVVSKTTAAIGPANHWSEAWTDLIRGVANVAARRARRPLFAAIDRRRRRIRSPADVRRALGTRPHQASTGRLQKRCEFF
jgi:hypothetical protein